MACWTAPIAAGACAVALVTFLGFVIPLGMGVASNDRACPPADDLLTTGLCNGWGDGGASG